MNRLLRKIRLGLGILWGIVKIKCFGKRTPLYCEWEISHYCNLDCRFCSTGASSNYMRGTELSTEEIFWQIDELQRAGTKIIHFSGGEPTLKKDFEKIVEYAKSKNILVAITSNGITNSETIRALFRADLVRISIDGKAELHDYLRKSHGAFDRSILTIKELNRHNIRPLINSVYTNRTTVDDVVPLMETIKNELNARITFISMGIAVNEKNTVETDLTPTVRNFLEFMAEIKRRYGSLVVTSDPYLTVLRYGGLDKYGCRVVESSVTLDPKGFVRFPCNALLKWKPKLDTSLLELYGDPKVEAMVKNQGKYPECEGCVVRCMVSATALLNLSGIFRLMFTYLAEIFYKKIVVSTGGEASGTPPQRMAG